MLSAVVIVWALQLLHWFGATDPCTAAMMQPVDWAQVQEAVCTHQGGGGMLRMSGQEGRNLPVS